MERHCAMIFTLLAIITVSLAANTYCLMDSLNSRAPLAVVGPQGLI